MDDKEKTSANGTNRPNGKEAIGHKLARAAAQSQFITRESTRQYLEKDLSSIYVLLSEILASKEIIDAITDVIYNRYEAMRKAKEAQPDLFEDLPSLTPEELLGKMNK